MAEKARDASSLRNEAHGNSGPVFQFRDVHGSLTLVQRGSRLAVGAVLGVLGLLLVHGVVLARYAEFYRTLGVGLGEVPVGYGEFVAATAEAVVVAATVVVVLVAAYAAGAALIAPAPSRALVAPTAALTTLIYLAGMVAVVYGAAYAALLTRLPEGAIDLVATLAAAVVGLGWLGSAARLIRRDNAYAYLSGCGIGGAAASVAAAPAVALRVWLLPQPWPLLLFFTGAAAAFAVLRRWARRRTAVAATVPGGGDGGTDGGGDEDGKDEGEDSATARPRDLLMRLLHDLVPFSDPRDLSSRVPGAQARRTVVALLVGVGLLGLLGLGGYILAAGSAVNAGLAVREYGYLPPERSALALPRTIRPVQVSPVGAGTDPAGICAAPERAATLIGREDGAAWLLLRPVEDDTFPPEVVPVSTDDYVVRLRPDSGLGSDPWTEPVCVPEG
ncbi:hypothetical protein [Nocardiopsis suaedae]|uniref:ABC transporter permease n=1 Tax=Nocardiopsis suaedae TaxID=3018444 RepID=A0ABT4TPM9_9ACTN|nr:hypothetical protein [Nocardiopsis suaedae]MDA2806643.1 hypothetical protein [Nocardiopsis suaedae]